MGLERCCMCHVFGTSPPQNHDQAHYFYHIINPQQSKDPRSLSVMNSCLPDGRSMAHLPVGHSKSLLAQPGLRPRVSEIKPGYFYVMQNKNRKVKDTCCRKNINTDLPRSKKKRGGGADLNQKHFHKLLVQNPCF